LVIYINWLSSFRIRMCYDIHPILWDRSTINKFFFRFLRYPENNRFIYSFNKSNQRNPDNIKQFLRYPKSRKPKRTKFFFNDFIKTHLLHYRHNINKCLITGIRKCKYKPRFFYWISNNSDDSISSSMKKVKIQDKIKKCFYALIS
jgi:hypothetical protein